MADKPTTARQGVGFHPVGVAAVSLGVFMWSASTVIVKDAHVSGVTFAVCRLWVGAAALWIVVRLSGRRVTREVWRASFVPGVLFAANIALFFEGLQRSTVANVTLITCIEPALIFLVAGRMFGERVTPWDVGWTAASIGGIGLVVAGAASRPGWHPSGDVMAFIAIFVWTVFFLASKRIRAKTATLEYFTGVLGAAAVSLTPVMLIRGGWFTDPSARDWLLIVIVALGPGTGGHLLVTWAHRLVDVSLSSVIGVAQPVIAAAGAAIFLGEELVPLQVVGGVITMASVIAVVRRRRVPDPELTPEGAP